MYIFNLIRRSYPIAVISLVLSLQSAHACSLRLSSRDGLLISFLNPSDQYKIPGSYSRFANNETDCVLYMDINWDDDVELRIARLNFGQPIAFYQTSIKVVRDGDNIFQTQRMEERVIVKDLAFSITGDDTRSFAVIYNKRLGIQDPFILRFTVTKGRDLLCPDLESYFNTVTCTNGEEINSNCRFQCPSGLYPSPDMFDPATPSVNVANFQSSFSQDFSSFCSLTERRRPAWKPGVLTSTPNIVGIIWGTVAHSWKCVDRKLIQEICLNSRRERIRLASDKQMTYYGLFGEYVFGYANIADCHYPTEYLLSIFDEGPDENLPGMTSTTTMMTSTEFVRTSTVFVMTSTDNEIGGFRPPVEPGRRPDWSEYQTTEDPVCNQHCVYSSTENAFTPKCGSYATTAEKLGCLVCRYGGSGCGQNDIIS